MQKSLQMSYIKDEAKKSFKGWTRKGLISALKLEVSEETKDALMDAYFKISNAIAKKQSTSLSQRLDGTGFKVIVSESSESYENEEENDPYDGLPMFYAYVCSTKDETCIDDTITGYYCNVDSVVSEIEGTVISLLLAKSIYNGNPDEKFEDIAKEVHLSHDEVSVFLSSNENKIVAIECNHIQFGPKHNYENVVKDTLVFIGVVSDCFEKIFKQKQRWRYCNYDDIMFVDASYQKKYEEYFYGSNGTENYIAAGGDMN